jgi:hypothetical protein
MVLSHIITRVKGLDGLELDVFIYDPSVFRHSKKIYDISTSDAWIPKKMHLMRDRIKSINTAVPHILRDSLEGTALAGRQLFYNAMSVYIKSKFSKIYPRLGLRIRFIPLRARMVNAEFLARFFLMKFQYKRNLVQIINPVSSRLLRRFGGVRIDCRGRFTKQQRAGKFNFRHGTVSLNNFSNRVDYSQVALPLKYGACSIKLWLANRLVSKEYGSEHEVSGFNSFNIMKLPVQRQNLSKFSLSLKKGTTAKRLLKFNSVKVPLDKIIKVGKVGKFRLTPKKRTALAFTGTNFYNRRVKLGKGIAPNMAKLSKAMRFRLLNKLLKKKAPSWHRKWAPSYRFQTTRELDRSVEKEVDKIKRDSVKHHAVNKALLSKFLSLRKYRFLKKPSPGNTLYKQLSIFSKRIALGKSRVQAKQALKVKYRKGIKRYGKTSK